MNNCTICGESGHLAPYGPNGEMICFYCGQDNPLQTAKMVVQEAFERLPPHMRTEESLQYATTKVLAESEAIQIKEFETFILANQGSTSGVLLAVMWRMAKHRPHAAQRLLESPTAEQRATVLADASGSGLFANVFRWKGQI